MIRAILIVNVLLSIFLAACCPVTSMHPLCKPADALFDARLAGAWHGGAIENDTGIIHFGKGPDNQTLVLAVEHKNDHTMQQFTFPVFISHIAEQYYMTIPLKTLGMAAAQKYQGYVIVQYQLTDPNTLVFSDIDDKALAQAITAKQINGEVSYEEEENGTKKVECVHMTDSTERLRKWLTSTKSKTLFRPYMTLKRIK